MRDTPTLANADVQTKFGGLLAPQTEKRAFFANTIAKLQASALTDCLARARGLSV